MFSSDMMGLIIAIILSLLIIVMALTLLSGRGSFLIVQVVNFDRIKKCIKYKD